MSFFEGKKILFFCHAGADIDSVCSAASIFFSLKKKSKCVIGVPDHISLHAKTFCQKTGLELVVNPEKIENFDVVFLLDLNSPEMLGSYAKKIESFSKQIFLIDHHKKTNSVLLQKAVCLVDEKAVSCTEVVFSYLKSCNAMISRKTALFLASGIIVDSGRFSVASKKTFSIMSELLEKSKIHYSVFFSLLALKEDISEKIAKLKAAKRARFFESFGNILALTQVNAFESTAAASLVGLGASVAFAGGKQNEKVLISARAKSFFVSENGFDLVKDVFLPLEKKFSGKGGGHAGAAGFNAENIDFLAALNECVLLVHVFLEKKHGKKAQLKEFD